MCWVVSLWLCSGGVAIQMQIQGSELTWPLWDAKDLHQGLVSNCDGCESVTGRNSADDALYGLKYATHANSDCTSAITAGWVVCEEDDCSCSTSLSLFSGKTFSVAPTPPLHPFPPRGTSFLPCLHAEIRSQRRSGLVFLGKSRTQTLTQNWGSRPFQLIANSLFPPPCFFSTSALVFINLQGNKAFKTRRHTNGA